jgi:alkylated DNA nucleotide flippase Atl1
MPEQVQAQDEPADAFADAVHELVASIPPGHALAYGDVAALLGSRAARQVGALMARSEGLPWWRVVRADGTLPPGLGERAAPYWRDERMPLARSGAGIDLRRARWDGR